MGITQGKIKQEALFVSLLYQFLGISTSENKYMEIVRALVMPLAPDAPGDNQFVGTSLSPEHIQLHDNPVSSDVGRLTWLIAANSQLKHRMR